MLEVVCICLRILEFLKDSLSLQDRAFSAIWPISLGKLIKFFLKCILRTNKSPLNFGSNPNPDPDSGSDSGFRIRKSCKFDEFCPLNCFVSLMTVKDPFDFTVRTTALYVNFITVRKTEKCQFFGHFAAANS